MFKRQVKSGFSLIEVLVSVSLFVVIILTSTDIFRMVINTQREAIANQNLQESLKYFYEVISKELRMARRNDGHCPLVPADKIYAVTKGTTGDILHFKNYYGRCVSYELAPDDGSQRFKISRDSDADFISPKKIYIENLRFVLDDSVQPTVTIYLEAYALGDDRLHIDMDIQTSITSRYYK